EQPSLYRRAPIARGEMHGNLLAFAPGHGDNKFPPPPRTSRGQGGAGTGGEQLGGRAPPAGPGPPSPSPPPPRPPPPTCFLHHPGDRTTRTIARREGPALSPARPATSRNIKPGPALHLPKGGRTLTSDTPQDAEPFAELPGDPVEHLARAERVLGHLRK